MDATRMEDVALRFVCVQCVSSNFLKEKIRSEGFRRGECACCGFTHQALTVVQIAAYAFQRRDELIQKGNSDAKKIKPRELAGIVIDETLDGPDDLDSITFDEICDFFEYYGMQMDTQDGNDDRFEDWCYENN